MLASPLAMLTFKARVNNPQSHMSNFYPYVRNINASAVQPDSADHLFVHPSDGAFKSVEHMYQYCKMTYVDHLYANQRIRHAPTPADAKQWSSKKAWVDYASSKDPENRPLRRRLEKEFDESVAMFRYICSQSTMKTALRLKYEQNEQLRKALLATGESPLGELGRFKTEFWTKTGQNMLGKLLMELRDELRHSS